MAAQLQRCFIALRPDEPTHHRLASLPLTSIARRVAPEDLHLTLAFLGALTPQQAQRLDDELPLFAGPLPGMAFEGIEYWPAPAHPRLAVATFTLCEALHGRVLDLQAILRSMSLPVEGRAFRPHVTLARFRDDAAPDTAAVGAAFHARFDALVLYSSSPTLQAARYTPLATFPLA